MSPVDITPLILVSPTEPRELQALGEIDFQPEQYGVDLLIVGKGMIGIQRKVYPADLTASIRDGRIYEQVRRMDGLFRKVMLWEGPEPDTTTDGAFISDPGFTVQQMLSLRTSLAFTADIHTWRTDSLAHTAWMVQLLAAWVSNPTHDSLRRRIKAPKSAWGIRKKRSLHQHILQSFDGIGPTTAAAIVDQFGGAPLTWTASVEELRQVPGVGKRTAQKLVEALEGA